MGCVVVGDGDQLGMRRRFGGAVGSDGRRGRWGALSIEASCGDGGRREVGSHVYVGFTITTTIFLSSRDNRSLGVLVNLNACIHYIFKCSKSCD